VENIREKAKRSLICDANSHTCICETLRSIYDLIHNFDTAWKDEITELLVDGIVMAKKMDARLVYYQKTYGDDSGNKASDLKFIHGNSKIRKMRRERVL
jgi:hypothetical protein